MNATSYLPGRGREVVLFSAWSVSWRREMPVTLIEHGNGRLDLHCQTGDHHRAAVNYGRRILNEMGISVSWRAGLIGPTGAYYSCRIGGHR